MTILSDNVQSAITAALQSASIHMDYVGDLHDGYHHDSKQQQLRSVAPGTTGMHVVNDNTLDRKKEQHNNDTPAIASTATGLPDPSAVVTAIENNDKKKEQGDANDEPTVASTAIGIPAPEPIISAMKEKGGDDEDSAQNDSATKENAAPLSNTLQKAINTVTSAAPVAAVAHNAIDNLAPSTSQDGPRPTPSTMKHQQQQPEKSYKQVDPSQTQEYVKPSADSDQGVQHATAGRVNSGATDVDSCMTANRSATPAVKEPTHTIIENSAKSVDPIPVEPMVQNIVAVIQAVEEPVVVEEIIRGPRADASTRPTPADVKMEPSPNVEVDNNPISENAVDAEQVAVTEGPAADEIMVEQAPLPCSSSTVTPPNIKQMANAVATDIKVEHMTVVEEPATTEDIMAESMAVVEQTKNDDDGRLTTDEPIKKGGVMNINDVKSMEQGKERAIGLVEQQPIVIDDAAKDDDVCISTTEEDTKGDREQTTPTTTVDQNKPHPLPTTPAAEPSELLLQQQPTAPIDTQSRSIESKSLPPQPLPQQQDQTPSAASTGQSQEQSTPESYAPKSSKCTIM